MGDVAPSVATQRLFRRLRAGFVASLAFALTALATIEALDVLSEREAARAAAEQRATDLALALAEHAAGVIREVDARLTAVAAEAADLEDPARLHELVKRHAEALRHVGSIIVLDAEARPAADSNASPPRPFRLGADPFFLRLRDDPGVGLQIGTPLRSRFTGEWIVGLSRRVTAHGEFRGAVAASLETERFRDFYAQLDVGPGGSITLIRSDGLLLMRQPHEEAAMGADLREQPLFGEHLKRSERGLFRAAAFADDEARFIAFQRVPGVPLVVTVGLAEVDVFAPWRAEALRRVGTLAVVAALACALGWFALRQIGGAERSAAALRASEERLRDFADAASDWYWETDRGHALSYLSEAIGRFGGYPPSVRIGRSRFDFQRPEDDPEPWRRHRADLDAHRPFRNFLYRRAYAAGRMRTISVSGKPLFDDEGSFQGYRGAASDVTDELDAERRRDEAESRLTKALDLSSDGYALTDSAGRFQFLNREYLRLNADLGGVVSVGERIEDALREAVRRGYFPQAIGREEAHIAERLAALRESRGAAITLRRGRWLRIQSEPLPDGGAFSVVRDVTAERNAGERLREAERLEAVRHFTGGVAHDFNNLLAVVLGNATLVREWIEGQPRSERALDAVLGAARRGRELTQQLLAYARRQSLEPVPVDIDVLLREQVEALTASLPKMLRVETQLAAGGWLVSIDRRQLRTALASLGLNAADAMPEGGRIVVATEALRLDGASAPEGCPPGDYVRLTVSDDGPGMPPEVAAKAFEPFFTTKEVGGGSGLGLSMVDGFVRQSGGAVALRTAPGAGAAFDLYFPRAAAGEDGGGGDAERAA